MTKRKPKEEHKKTGRPSEYDRVDLAQVEKLCRLGATDKDIADFYSVSEKTVNTWKEKHPEFLQSLKKAKDELDAKVVRSLFERATGYSHPDTDIRTADGQIVMTPIIKHYPPDTTAAIFWLKNRQPDKWRDKQEVEHSGEATIKTFNIVPASKATKKDLNADK